MHNQDLRNNKHNPKSLIQFIQAKPLWESNIINNFKENTNAAPLLHFLTNKIDLFIAPDGSKIATKSDRGWGNLNKGWYYHNQRVRSGLWADILNVPLSQRSVCELGFAI